VADRRLAGDWLSSYLDFTSNLEAKEQLHMWTGLIVLSSVVRRQLYLDMEHGMIYPNLYVIIVAQSARARKSTAMDVGRDLLIDAIPDIKVMRDSMTSQGLIKQLNRKTQGVRDGKIVEELRSDVAIFADEVANLFSYERTRAAQMVIFLTRTYSCPTIYDHTTVRDSMVRLHNLYPVLLGGTDPHNLKVLPEDAIGGLTGRLIMVIESQRRDDNSGWKRDEAATLKRKLLREYLIHDLQRIGKLSGELQVARDAQDFYDSWYRSLSQKDTKDQQMDAFFQRCHTTALRIASLLSISESDDLTVTTPQMKRAIELIELQRPAVQQVTMWTGSSSYEQSRAKMIDFLQKSPGGAALRKTLLKFMGMGMEEFDKLRMTLVEDGTLDPQAFLGKEAVIKLAAKEKKK
jgi:Protein of unknown function (DUF3987)